MHWGVDPRSNWSDLFEYFYILLNRLFCLVTAKIFSSTRNLSICVNDTLVTTTLLDLPALDLTNNFRNSIFIDLNVKSEIFE